MRSWVEARLKEVRFQDQDRVDVYVDHERAWCPSEAAFPDSDAEQTYVHPGRENPTPRAKQMGNPTE